MIYAIAGRFSEDVRRKAASETYLAGRTITGGRCPMGVCLTEIPGWDDPVPSAFVVAIALGSPFWSPGREGLLIEAGTFIRDWDLGRITNLAAALGVTD